MNIQSEDKLPRICYILGGEDTPLKVREEFSVQGIGTGFHINEDGVMKWGGDTVETWQLCEAINHPEKIIRQPQFSEDEKALMRLCGENGYWGWYRDEFGGLHVKEFDEEFGLIVEAVSMKGITKEYTKKNPFNAAEYLEGLK